MMNAASMRNSPVAPTATTAVSALTAVATPTAPDRPAQHDAAAPRRFAELLRQSRSERAAPAAAAPAEPAVPAASSAPACETEDRTDGETDAVPARRSATPAKARTPVAKGATGKASVDGARARAEPVASDADRDEDAVASAAPTSTDERAASLAALAAAAPSDGSTGRVSTRAEPTGGPSAPASNGDAETSLAAVPPEDARRGASHARGDAVVDAAIGRVAFDPSIARAMSTFVDPGFDAASGDAVRAIEAPASSRATLASDAAAASLAAGSSTPVVHGEARGLPAAPATLAFAVPIDAPDFAAALGIQVSLLAHDGVQHAELHLHPAETGPLSIHIAVDGNAARVDFGADHAATRQAIERGLPELASALRDAGLTLTGGSVSQHAGSRQSGDGGAAASKDRPDGVGAAAPIATTARIPRRSAAGGVDLYA